MMPYTREYPTEKLEQERQAGLLVCRCDFALDDYEYLPLWDTCQCKRCGKPKL
jgi:hypothetical protein